MFRSSPEGRSFENGLGRRTQGLGWFSLGLGVAQLVAPGGLAKAVGAPNQPRTRMTMLSCGLREIATGVGILAGSRPGAAWFWSRVAGDLIDIVLLSTAMRSSRARRGRVLLAAGAVLGVTLLDAATALQLSRKTAGPARRRAPGVDATASITAPPSTVPGCAPSG